MIYKITRFVAQRYSIHFANQNHYLYIDVLNIKHTKKRDWCKGHFFSAQFSREVTRRIEICGKTAVSFSSLTYTLYIYLNTQYTLSRNVH